MWWIIIPVTVLLSIILYLLFAPFFVEIDSNRGIYRVRFHQLASMALIYRDESIYVVLKIAWWVKEFDLLSPKITSNMEPVKKQPVERKEKSFQIQKIWKRIWNVIKTFKLTKCHILIDTGDMPFNGILYPWFYLLSRVTGKTVMINFEDENVVILEIRNSIARMLWAFINA